MANILQSAPSRKSRRRQVTESFIDSSPVFAPSAALGKVVVLEQESVFPRPSKRRPHPTQPAIGVPHRRIDFVTETVCLVYQESSTLTESTGGTSTGRVASDRYRR